MRVAAWIKFVGLPSAGIALLYSGSLKWYPPAAAGLLSIAGRGPECGLVQTLQASRRLYRRYPVFAQDMHRSARLLRKDDAAGLQLVQTAKGDFWEPIVEGFTATVQLAELASKYDGMGGLPVRPGDIVLDCGANIGTFTRAALERGAGLVVAVEPAPINVECLRRNFASEISSGRVVIAAKGVWDKEATLQLREDTGTSTEDGFIKQENTRPGPLVPLTTIDRLADALKLKRIDLIKVDIEGAERQALAGAAGILARDRPRVEVSVNHLPDDPEVVPRILRSAWPSYRAECLWCALEPLRWKVRANILFFRP